MTRAIVTVLDGNGVRGHPRRLLLGDRGPGQLRRHVVPVRDLVERLSGVEQLPQPLVATPWTAGLPKRTFGSITTVEDWNAVVEDPVYPQGGRIDCLPLLVD